jgi:hypothetical protein
MRPRTLVLLCVIVAAVATLISVPLAFGAHGFASAHPASTIGPTGSPNVAGQPAAPAPTLVIPKNPSAITAPDMDYFGWSLIDLKTGKTAGSTNSGTTASTVESMIKGWIAADYLRNHDQPTNDDLGQLTKMIVNSDDNVAQTYYKLNGGDASIADLVGRCGLKDTHPATGKLAGWWSYVTMSPADAARMGQCIADGRAAGPKFTSWLLTTMRNVQGTVDQQQLTSGGGRWGIIDGLPAALQSTTSIKNGWTPQESDHDWHINCLAINPGNWVLAIELQYPWTSPTGKWEQADNLATGANTCESVTKQLVARPDV